MSLKIAAIWWAHGEEVFAENLRCVHANASRFSEILEETGQCEIAVRPESNIVCFRLKTPGIRIEEANALHRRIRSAIVSQGEFYIVQTLLQGQVWLRTALMNPFTSEGDLRALLHRVTAWHSSV